MTPAIHHRPNSPLVRARAGLLVLVLMLAVTVAPSLLMPPPAARGLGTATDAVRLALVRPGTVVGTDAPQGWTHLILKSQPSLTAAERERVGRLTADYAVMFFTSISADVRRSADGYRLARLGYGIGTTVNGHPVAVSPETAASQGVELGFLGPLLLETMFRKQREVRLVTAFATGAVVDTPTIMAKGTGHAMIVLRYLHTVDPLSGELNTFVWRIDHDANGIYEGTVGEVEWLAVGEQIDVPMKADLGEFTLGIPSERGFAILKFSADRQHFAIPPGLQSIAGAKQLTPTQAETLERSFLTIHRREPHR